MVPKDTNTRGDEPSLSVVVPAREAAAELPQCLEALFRAGFPPNEVLVVDDGSADGTGDIALARGVRVIGNERPLGAAAARNRGARSVKSEIIVFVDADVLVHPDARHRILQAFADPNLAALFGSYDDNPPAPAVVAQYRNLLHHYVHQCSRAEASTFWTGLGAVRREVFLELGGFDPAWEKIEDSEFGVRLHRAGGCIRLDPGLLGTHLKAWTIMSMFRTDLSGRGIPWTRLVLFAGGPKDDLNLTWPHRASAVLVALFGLALLLALTDGLWLLAALVAAAGFTFVNRAFFGFLARRNGLAFAAAALPLHALHYLAGGLGFVWVLLTEGPAHLLTRHTA